MMGRFNETSRPDNELVAVQRQLARPRDHRQDLHGCGGESLVESQPGRGGPFTVRLPILENVR